MRVFFYKTNEEDRDCVNYADLERLGKLECNHYFPKLMVTGACFSGGEDFEDLDFENITTILTKDDFIKITEYNDALRDLEYGIKEGDERYLKGIQLYNNILPILEKLKSQENEDLFNKVIEEEKEYLKEEYSLDDEDIELIFDTYYLEYRDRGIVSHVFNDIEECAEEEAEQMGYVSEEHIKRYFDYEKFGADLLQEEQYLELKDGRIVVLNY